MPIIQNIPTQVSSNGRQSAEGYLTSTCMDTRQRAGFRPERVIPVIFLPGIMGSNLRFCDETKGKERQRRLGKKDNVAWRPDNKAGAGWTAVGDKPAERQLRLDPEVTVVDVYDPKTNPGADERHSNVNDDNVVKVPPESPLLMDDPCTMKNRKTAAQKARERGWSEIMFSSYGQLLNHLELRLNLAFQNGKLNPDWKDIVGIDPKQWQVSDNTPLSPLSEGELRMVTTNCYYPVHAFGYNWLQSNGIAAKEIAKRIQALMADYNKKNFKCEKVIVVTHSMGGLVGRALCHPKYGNLKKEILGIVHGEMPAIGAAAAYRRMRAGFEGGDAPAWVIGDQGSEVTPVLANAVGGLQLLPSKAYGNGWLKIVDQNGNDLRKPLPENGDPYKEIYQRTDVWWGLLREAWINPAGQKGCGVIQSLNNLNKAKEFHQDIKDSFHPITYAHYGCDGEQKAYQTVTWKLVMPSPSAAASIQGQASSSRVSAENVDTLRIMYDSTYGTIALSADPKIKETTTPSYAGMRSPEEGTIRATILPPTEPGDKTVPMHSAEYVARNGKENIKGIFRQTGYEHQGSYQDPKVIAATLYAIVRIAQRMEGWWTSPSSSSHWEDRPPEGQDRHGRTLADSQKEAQPYAYDRYAPDPSKT